MNADRTEPRPPSAPAGDGWRASRGLRRWGFVAGLLLLAGAVYAGFRGTDPSQLVRALRDAPVPLLVAGLTLPILNWILSAHVLWLLSRRFAPVPWGDMTLLAGAAGLANYLPLRPGMLGRVAYHKKFHGLAVTHSARVLVESVLCGLPGLAATLAVALLWSSRGPMAIVLIPLALLALSLAVVFARARLAPIVYACWVRWLDTLVWVGRYWVVLAIVGWGGGAGGGESPRFEQAAALACVSQIASLVPLAGNGLGLREWAVGLTSSILPEWARGVASDGAALKIGLQADLVNRALELPAAIVVGVLCGSVLARRHAHARPGIEPPRAEKPSPVERSDRK